MVESPEAFQQLKSQWDDLRRRTDDVSPFQSPEWMLPWWRTFGSGEMFSVAVWGEQGLVGLAPMFIPVWEERRQVTFIGNGVSDQLGFLVDRRYAEEATSVAKGVARFYAFWLGGKIVASVYALFENRRTYSYLGGFPLN